MPGPSRKEQLEAMLAEDPKDPFLHYGLAMEHLSAGDDRKAVEVFRGLTELAPDYVPAYMQMGQALLRLGQADEARTVWQRGVVEAHKQGNDHASGEMQGMIEMLD
jgi:Flp pilus assembly protein TadD